jgi:hypothetical protein
MAGAITTLPEAPGVRALEAIESHLAVTLGDPAAVEAAYHVLAGPLDHPDRAIQLRLAHQLRHSRSRAAPALFRLLARAASSDGDAGPLLSGLLAARSADLRTQAMELVVDLVGQGRVKPDLDLVAAVAAAATGESAASLPADLRDVLARVDDARLPLARGDPLGRLLEPSVPLSVRLLAARLLDSEDLPAPPDRVERVLGRKAAVALAHHLAFTRARHEDLVALTPGPQPRVLALESLMASEMVLGRDRLAAVLASLGWARCAIEVTAEPIARVRVEGSFPFILHPRDARLVDQYVETTTVGGGWIVAARGLDGSGTTTRGGAADPDPERIARFRRLSLDHAELLGELLEVAPITVERATAILLLLDRIVADHAALFTDIDPEASDLAEHYGGLRGPVARVLEDAPDPAEVLAVDVAYRIQAFEEPGSLADVRTLHGLKRYLHQRGLRHAFRLFGSGGAANRTLDLALVRDGQPHVLVRRIRYIDFEEQEGPGLPLAVRLVADAYRAYVAHGITDLPAVRTLIYGTETQFYVSYRNHPAFIRLDLSPPRRGGMIDLEYFAVSQYELTDHPALDVPGVQRVLRRLGFFVELDGTRLHARYDKERAVELSDIVEKAALLMRLVPRLMDLDWALASLDLSQAERLERADQWAEFLVRHGMVPPPAETLPGSAAPYLVRRLRRHFVRDGIRVPLTDAGAVPLAGHQDLFRGIVAPLRAAMDRGEVVEVDGRLAPAEAHRYRREHEAARLARLLAGRPARLREAIRLAAVIRPLERWLRFVPAGTVQGYPVERATLALRDRLLTVFVLRDGRGQARVAFASRESVPYRVRSAGERAWRRPAEVGLSEFRGLLVRDNYRSPGKESRPVDDPVAEVRALFAAPNPRPPCAPLPGDRSVPAVPASPGRAAGFARIATPDRPPADFQGAVLVAPNIGPGDYAALATAVAAVSTGGGTLSHIGLLALELGKPSVIVQGRWRRQGGEERVLVLDRTEVSQRSGRVRSLAVRCWARVRQHEVEVREGDLVVVDSGTSTFDVLGSDRDALVLHQGIRDLEATSREVAAARDDAALLPARGRLLRIMHQLERALSRVRQPALVQYSVLELITAQSAPDAAQATPQRRRLLQTLCRSPAVGPSARAARDAAVDAMAEQLAAAIRTAEVQIPFLPGPLEVLFARLRVAGLRDGLEAVRALEPDPQRPTEVVGPFTHVSNASPVDDLARRRLQAIRAGILEDLRGAPHDGPCPHRLTAQVQALEWIQQVLPGTGSPAESAALEAARERLRTRRVGPAETAGERLVLHWTALGPGMEAVVGPKAAGLARVAAALPPGRVPPWFVVTDAAFRLALESPVPRSAGARDLEAAIQGVLREQDVEAGRRARRIRDLWLDVQLAPELEGAIRDAYVALAPHPDAAHVAVRSSAAEEDSADATWAGQFDTFLNVAGAEDVVRHVRLAWAGLWSPRALAHRDVDVAARPAGGGVLVQRMVDSRVAGVVLTADAAAGELRELVVNAGLGLGDGIVSGTVNADEIHVARNDRRGGPLRLRYRVADKRERSVRDVARGAGTRQVETLFHQRLRPALEYTELELLVDAALSLEGAFGEPLDVEFALEGPNLWILQARPIPLFRTALRETLLRHPLTEAAP